MASKTTMKIQFPGGGIIPKEVLKLEADKSCAPGEPVTVPRAYGEHLVSDRFAQEVVATSAKAKASDKAGEADSEDAEASLADASA